MNKALSVASHPLLVVVFLAEYKETMSGKTTGVHLHVMNIYLRSKIYLKTLVGR